MIGVSEQKGIIIYLFVSFELRVCDSDARQFYVEREKIMRLRWHFDKG